ncbi:Nuclease sbcCD subunit C [Kluyvera cryocrescens]|uniref:Nuclease sbcCD subunit C n=1 Tax=Kluyvera cryocrescens TaxID=580 RepID=A0A485D378_KLUCR|nr:Nuclease sbcCD subunit C [Kluyvera cryocrescens]
MQEALQKHLTLRPETLTPEITLSDTQTQLQQLAQQLRENSQRQGELRQQLKQDESNRQQQQSLFLEIEKANATLEDWAHLNALIGSKEGDKFRKFAQGLTLDNLVWLANEQLSRLHGRYLLQRKASDALELEVVDTWQADAVRDTRTLSGGESFLVSLALALALSDLVSHKTRIDSLFLDEGFGTLDSETLDTALDALDTLNASGKIIGVISHVEAMKERIPVQIKVKKINGLGYSRLDKMFAIELKPTSGERRRFSPVCPRGIDTMILLRPQPCCPAHAAGVAVQRLANPASHIHRRTPTLSPVTVPSYRDAQHYSSRRPAQSRPGREY